MHLGLTHWLAEQVGFTKQEAREIATADEAVDQGETDPVKLGIKIFFFNSEEASVLLRDNHFPAAGLLPGLPRQRKVQSNSPEAQASFELVLRNPGPNPLMELGKAIHTFQDSWSHEGESDVPLGQYARVHEQLAWGHPGRWLSHRPDLTYLHPNEASSMACRTYQLLTIYFKHFGAGKQPVRECKHLDKDIREFAKAETKQEKFDWMAKHGFTCRDAVNIAAYLNLRGSQPECPRTILSGDTSASVMKVALDGNLDRRTIPSYEEFDTSLRDFIDNFLYQWIVAANPEKAAESLSQSEIREQLRMLGFGRKEEGPTLNYAMKWGVSFMYLWLMRDHSEADELQHGLHPDWEEPLAELPGEIRYQASSFDSLDQAIRWDRGLYELVPLVRDEPFIGLKTTYAVIFKFIHAPRDGVVFIVRAENRGWTIIRLFSLLAG